MSEDATPVDPPADEETVTLYEAAGGQEFFDRLVAAFYDGVMVDPVLAPLYPPDDIAGAQRRLSLFLVQFWGGPLTYLEERGHPKLRMRHMPFHIGPEQRDRWLVHMRAAIDRVDPHPVIRTMLLEYFEPAAEALRNDTGLPISSSAQRPST